MESIYLSNLCKHEFIIIRSVCVHDGRYTRVMVCLSKSEDSFGSLFVPSTMGSGE